MKALDSVSPDLRPPATTESVDARHSCEVLVVDPSSLLRERVIALLSLVPGVRVREAADGRDARALLLRHPPDVVLLDLELPVEDGMAMLAEIHRARPACAVIVLAAPALGSLHRKCRDLGCYQFLDKATQFDAALALVRRMAEKYPVHRAS